MADFGQEFLASGKAGVYYYENDSGTFRAQRLADQAQALTLALTDFNSDGWLDILVGNDFGLEDYAWLNSAESTQPISFISATPFANTTHITMSFALGDINNDGRADLFASDMKPYQDDDATLAAWEPVMSSMMADPHLPNDPQLMENVLQVASGDAF